jgi:hypothetical protein
LAKKTRNPNAVHVAGHCGLRYSTKMNQLAKLVIVFIFALTFIPRFAKAEVSQSFAYQGVQWTLGPDGYYHTYYNGNYWRWAPGYQPAIESTGFHGNSQFTDFSARRTYSSVSSMPGNFRELWQFGGNQVGSDGFYYVNPRYKWSPGTGVLVQHGGRWLNEQEQANHIRYQNEILEKNSHIDYNFNGPDFNSAPGSAP